MKIIIGGAGEVGFHLAKLLSNEMLDIIVMDTDKERLTHIENSLDVMTYRGDITSFKSLREVNVESADMFISVSQLQNTNLTSALIAKKMGTKRTIARISNPEYLLRENQLAVQRFGIDALISPELLAANEIKSLIEQSAFNEMHTFDGGRVNLLGTVLDHDCRIINKKYKDVYLTAKGGTERLFMPIAIIRFNPKSGYETLIPTDETVFKNNDQVYFISKNYATLELYKLLGKKQDYFHNVILLGGGSIGKKTARLLKADKHNVKIIEKNRDRAFDLADEFNNILIIYGDGSDGDLLEDEGISEADAFIAVTGSSETNIMSCLLAKSKGVRKTIALVENIDYIHLSQEIGISAFINKKLLTADGIFRYVRQGQVLDVFGISDLDAEVLEFKIEEHSVAINKTVGELNIKNEAVIGGVVRKGEAIIPTLDFVLEQGDHVIFFSFPSALKRVTRYFR